MALRRPIARAASGTSKRVQTFEPAPPINWLTGRPYGDPGTPEIDERRAAELAAGQLALATAEAPGAARARLLAEADKYPERFRSPLNPTPEQAARRTVLRRGGRR